MAVCVEKTRVRQTNKLTNSLLNQANALSMSRRSVFWGFVWKSGTLGPAAEGHIGVEFGTSITRSAPLNNTANFQYIFGDMLRLFFLGIRYWFFKRHSKEWKEYHLLEYRAGHSYPICARPLFAPTGEKQSVNINFVPAIFCFGSFLFSQRFNWSTLFAIESWRDNWRPLRSTNQLAKNLRKIVLFIANRFSFLPGQVLCTTETTRDTNLHIVLAIA